LLTADHLYRYIHALIQVLRLAFADGMQHIADPSTTSLDYKTLLSPSYLASRAKLFDPARATSWPIHGHPALQAHDTVYLAVTDADGNACSFVNSVSETFGSLVVPRGVGFVLHSRGAGFNLQEGHPNAYAPRKRPYNTIMTALVTRPTHPTIEPKSNEPQAAQPQKPSHDQQDAGDLLMVLGVMGGAMQPQGHVQVLLNMALFGMDPQRALDAPRLCIGVSLPGKSTNPSKKVDEAVYLEDGVPDHVAGALRAMGYEVEVVRGMKRALFGRGQVIAVQEEKGGRMFAAGSDMRGDGAAAPLV
jgi:gamma-glutamyltranspeptidase/glutathione hydrolase